MPDRAQDPHRHPAPDSLSARSRWRLIKNILSGVIGVQGEQSHPQDLPQESLESYATKVVVGLVLFVLVVVLIAW